MAEKTLQVKRLAINRQAAVEFSMRAPPTMPPEMLKRFPELSGYDDAWKKWSEETQNLIRSILSLKLDTQ